MRKTTIATQSCLNVFPYKSLLSLKLLNCRLTHLMAQIVCYELKGNLSPVMLKEIFLTVMKISKLQGFVWKTMQV